MHLYNENRKGAPGPPSYQYDGQLRTDGSRYAVPVDISQAIKPGEFDRFTFRVAASQSSQHMFRARFIYNGDKAVVCAPIILKYFMPRSATNRLRAAAPQAAPK